MHSKSSSPNRMPRDRRVAYDDSTSKGGRALNNQTFIFLMFISFFICLLLWDMQRMHEMSVIIHDDHTTLWERMNESSIVTWYSNADLCQLYLNDTSTAKLLRINKYCNSKSPAVTVQNKAIVSKDAKRNKPSLPITLPSQAQHFACTIGGGLGSTSSKSCTTPLSQHSYFFYRLRDSRFSFGLSDKIIKALRILAKYRIPVLFIGDGLSKQNQEAMICELLRIEPTGAISVSSNSNNSISSYVIKWRNEDLELVVKYLKMSYIVEPDSVHVPKRKHSSYSKQLLRRSLTTAAGSAELKISNQSITQVSISEYRMQTFSQVKKFVAEELMARNGTGRVAVIANIGVWYNSREKFREELPAFLRYLDDLGKERIPSGKENANVVRNIILYRETAAQHWNHTENGYYDFEYHQVENNNGTCVPIADSTPELDWRNIDVYNTIENEDYSNIRMIQFHKLTMPLYNMHPTNARAQDCTHFCYFPQMWQPIWMELYNATLSL